MKEIGLEETFKVAELYYFKKQTQQQIADKLNYSRPMISKILSDAQELGIVTINVRNPTEEAERFSRQIEDIFSTEENPIKVIVVPSSSETDLTENRVCETAAKYLEANICDGEIIGIGRGYSVYGLVNKLSGNKRLGIQTVPLTGGLGSVDSLYQVNETARKAALNLGGVCNYIYSPVYLGHNTTKNAILTDPVLKPSFNLWEKLDWAIVGIGAIFQSDNTYYKNWISNAELETGQKVTADLCVNLIDFSGKPVESSSPVVAINLSQLRRTKKVMAVASGTFKSKAILSCLRGNWIDVLITDEYTAMELINNSKQ